VTDHQGSWDLEFEAWRGALAPRGEAPARGVNLAELPVRGIAFLIDVVLIWLTSSMWFPMFSFLTSHTILQPGAGGVTDQALAAWLAFGLPFIALAAIQAVAYVFLWRVYRASPGQMTLGLFTLHASRGMALSKRQAFVRWLLLLFPALIMTSADAISYVGFYSIAPKVEQAVFSGMALLIPFLWYVVLTISILLNSQGRGLHDRLARSVVVRREGSAS